MEKTKRRIRILLLAVLMFAVIIGAVYYFQTLESPDNRTDGTLVVKMCGWEGNNCYGIRK
ncbi:MAG: hypothetical protein ACI4F1_02540 [Bariatricus sp.]